jgi:hypothetical protein
VVDELRRCCIRLSGMAGIHRLVPAYLHLHRADLDPAPSFLLMKAASNLVNK